MTTSSSFTPAIQTFYDRTLLKRATPRLVHDKFGQTRKIPKNSGNQIKFRRVESFTAATTPLTEGTPPAGQDMTKTDMTFTLVQYGDYCKYTDMVTMTNQDPVLTELAEVMGEQMGNTLDQIYREVLVAGTAVRYASAVGARNAIIQKILADDLDKVIRQLRRNNAEFIKPQINAAGNIGTVGIRMSYFAIIHPDTLVDLEAITGYRSVTEYASQTGVMEGEEGAYKNIRFISSTNAKMWADAGGTATTNSLKFTTGNTACDVYATLVFGKDAYAICPLDVATIKYKVKPLGSAGATDPLDQYGTAGWKATTVCGILNNNFMFRIEHGVSA